MSVDGEYNSVHEVNAVVEHLGPDDPHGNAFRAEATPPRTEPEARRAAGPLKRRGRTISNLSVSNAWGGPGRKSSGLVRTSCPLSILGPTSCDGPDS